MNVCIIGTGYVGLVTGACFAEFGAQVVCADTNADKIAALQDGKIPIYEPGLEGLVERNVRQGRLSFSTDTAEAIRASLIIFIAVPTPPRDDGSTDLTAVESVAREIGSTLDGYKAEILFTKILKLGAPGLLVAWGVTPVIVIFMYIFGTKILKMQSKSLTIVIATATSVCGVSAAIAAAAASKAKREELSLAVGMTMIFIQHCVDEIDLYCVALVKLGKFIDYKPARQHYGEEYD